MKYRSEQELFDACLELAPPERSGYLDDACGEDAPLRSRVERLLDAHEKAGNRTLNPMPSWLADTAEPETIGPYRLERVLGEGGMGVVYEARQLEPLDRRVALKIVKLGLDTRQVLARFAMEMQVLAALDHPYVARVFDAGQTASGRPYFVMELVDGVPLLEYCDGHGLSIPQRLQLFIKVCQAVQHSHQKGVIHRDLKPSNILVHSNGATPAPKIIDFGIAKAVGRDAASRVTELTRAEQALGTPAYMSPEQAGLGGQDVDTRADVYSLGVILYELLAGCLPVDPRANGYAEFLAHLAKGELALRRPSMHRRQLAGDLDWIVMKALQTDRERRYATAIALADDLERHLRREPVAARPPAISYRVGRFVRRHRMEAAACCLAFLALVGGTVAAAAGFVRASHAEAAARSEAAASRQVSDFLVRLFGSADPNGVPSGKLTMLELLERGASRIETELKGQPRVQSNMLGTLGHVYDSLGKFREAGALAERALALERAAKLPEDLKTADSLLSLGRVQQRLGQFEAAQASLTRGLEIRLRLEGENSLEVSTILNNLGALEGQREHFEEALAAHRRAMAIQRRVGGPDDITISGSWRGIGIVEDRRENWQAALEAFRAAQPIMENRYGPEHPAVADGLNNMARMLWHLHRLGEARSLTEQALEIQTRLLGPDHPKLGFTLQTLGHVLEEQGELHESLAMFQKALRLFESAYGAEHPYTGTALENLGQVQERLGDLSEARRLLARSYEIHRHSYGEIHSDTVESLRRLARVDAEIAQLRRP